MTYFPSEMWESKATSFFSVAFRFCFCFFSYLWVRLLSLPFLFLHKSIITALCFLFPSAQLEVVPWWWISHLCKLADSLYFKLCGGRQNAHPTSLFSFICLVVLGTRSESAQWCEWVGFFTCTRLPTFGAGFHLLVCIFFTDGQGKRWLNIILLWLFAFKTWADLSSRAKEGLSSSKLLKGCSLASARTAWIMKKHQCWSLVVIISLKCQQSTSNQAFCNTRCVLIRKEASSPILCGCLSSGIFIAIIILILKHSVGR